MIAVICIAVGFILFMIAAIGGYLWHVKKLKEKKRRTKLEKLKTKGGKKDPEVPQL